MQTMTAEQKVFNLEFLFPSAAGAVRPANALPGRQDDGPRNYLKDFDDYTHSSSVARRLGRSARLALGQSRRRRSGLDKIHD